MTAPANLRYESPCRRLFWIDRFLEPNECSRILDELRFAFWYPSTVYVRTDKTKYTFMSTSQRISQSTWETWFTPQLKLSLRKIERRLKALVPEFLDRRESWQATQYFKGNGFDYHLDSGSFAHEPSGERVNTILLYLNKPRRGGNTHFQKLDIDVAPAAGRLVVWTNLRAGAIVDSDMLHSSVPILEGRKTILTTWVRQRPHIRNTEADR